MTNVVRQRQIVNVMGQMKLGDADLLLRAGLRRRTCSGGDIHCRKPLPCAAPAYRHWRLHPHAPSGLASTS
jgi:hypothetical protein